jgi:hypothetical protein
MVDNERDVQLPKGMDSVTLSESESESHCD